MNKCIKALSVLMCLTIMMTLIGCHEAENLLSDQSGAGVGNNIKLYTSWELNRFVKSSAEGEYVVDQYGNKIDDCKLDFDGNIFLNNRLIIKSTDVAAYTLPSHMLLADITVDIAVNEAFDPKAVFIPELTSCKEVKVEVIEGAYRTDENGVIYFTTPGNAICKVTAVADETLTDTCNITVYNSPDDFPEKSVDMKELGGVYAADFFGLEKHVYLKWLTERETTAYYLGTPYDSDWNATKPNGDTPPTEEPGLNCTGFVWHALYIPTKNCFGKAELIPELRGWYSFYTENDLKRYSFKTKEDMLNSGILQKGDIIWIWDQNGESNRSSDHHVGIYWGDGTSDIFWHSLDGLDAGFPIDGNMITHIGSAAKPSKYVVIDMYQ